MADQTKRQSYPFISEKNWWELRKRFIRMLPTQVDAGYLQSVLGLQEGSAKAVLPNLKSVGLIDDNGKPTELAEDWRSDDHYQHACSQILDSTYPSTLREAFPASESDRKGIENWFMRETRAGRSHAGKLAGFYVLMNQSDLSAQDQSTGSGTKKERTLTVRKPRHPAGKATQIDQNGHEADNGASLLGQVTPRPAIAGSPSIHLDIQIHISADAKAEQIDQVFASMAKHFGLNGMP